MLYNISQNFINFKQYLISTMKITVKTLKGDILNIEAEPTSTILQLKNQIKTLKGFQIQSQKIVYKGKATNNQDTLQKLNIKETDFLVVMSVIKKPQSKKQQIKQEKKEVQKKQANEVKPQKVEPKQQGQSPQFQAKITQLLSMGFPRQKCVQALKAAFNDSDRAVQYLLNGIPAHLGQAGNQNNANSANALGNLLGNPQFAEVRQLLRSDPTAIQPLLQQLSQTSPQLYNMISQHPEQFQRLIIQGDDGSQFQGEQFDVQGEGQGEEGAIMVTQAEQQAIQRLSALGFSKIEAAQAYIACDKNQEMAANLLFDRLANGDIQQGFPQDEPGQQGEDDDDNLFG